MQENLAPIHQKNNFQSLVLHRFSSQQVSNINKLCKALKEILKATDIKQAEYF